MEFLLEHEITHHLFSFLMALGMVLSVFALVIFVIVEYHIARHSNINVRKRKA